MRLYCNADMLLTFQRTCLLYLAEAGLIFSRFFTETMKRFSSQSTLVFIVALLVTFTGCDVVGEDSPPLENGEFESGYFYYSDSRKIELHRSHRIVAVQFHKDVSVDRAKELARAYNLQLFERFQPGGGNWAELLDHDLILFRLPEDAKLDDYVTEYPKSQSMRGFGNQTEVRFAVPSYAFQPSGDLKHRLFIFDEIIAKSTKQEEQVRAYAAMHGLEVLAVDEWGEYVLRVTVESPNSTLPMANDIYESDMFVWSVPNAYTPGLRPG